MEPSVGSGCIVVLPIERFSLCPRSFDRHQFLLKAALVGPQHIHIHMHANVTRALTDSWVWTWHQILQALCLFPAHFHITISGHVHSHTHTHTLKLCFALLFNSFPRLPFFLAYLFLIVLSILFIFRLFCPSRHKEKDNYNFSPLVVNEKSTSRFHPCFVFCFSLANTNGCFSVMFHCL